MLSRTQEQKVEGHPICRRSSNEGRCRCPKEPDRPDGSGKAWLIQRLAQETGITETQPAELVTLTGMDWSSLRPGSAHHEDETLTPVAGSHVVQRCGDLFGGE